MNLPASFRLRPGSWLHGNALLVLGSDACALIDSCYYTGAEGLLAWVEAERGTRPLVAHWLTHVHSDHAGGVAAIRERFDVPVHAHAAADAIVSRWDRRALWLEGLAQDIPRFSIDAHLEPGDVVSLGEDRFRVVDLPGHARGGVGFFHESSGWLLSGDALWENGLGMLRPAIDGPGVYEDARLALDRIEALAPAGILPGHGAPFVDIAPALARAREKISRWEADPAGAGRAGLAAGIAFWLLVHDGAAEREALVAMVAGVLEEDGHGGEGARAFVDQMLARDLLIAEGTRVRPGPKMRA